MSIGRNRLRRTLNAFDRHNLRCRLATAFAVLNPSGCYAVVWAVKLFLFDLLIMDAVWRSIATSPNSRQDYGFCR
jgi:hypothetical protein